MTWTSQKFNQQRRVKDSSNCHRNQYSTIVLMHKLSSLGPLQTHKRNQNVLVIGKLNQNSGKDFEVFFQKISIEKTIAKHAYYCIR